MKRNHWLAAAAVATTLTGTLAAGEVQSQIVKLDVFKNGVGVVTQKITAGKDASGVYPMLKPLSSLNGTFFLSGQQGVSVESRRFEQMEKFNAYGASPYDLYADCEVTVYLMDGDDEIAVRGRVFAPKDLPEDAEVNFNAYPAANRLILQIGSEFMMLDASRISRIVGNTINQEKKVKKDGLLFLSAEALEDVQLHTLSNGIAWAPAYTINLLSADRMNLRQSAVVRNELSDFKEVEVRLISGFPNMVSRNVGSLMDPGMTLANFFAQLNNGNPMPSPMMTQNRMMKAMAMADTAGFGERGQAPELPPDGVDLFFQPLGKISMDKNESRYFELANQDTEYRKILEWTIPARQELERFGNNSSQREEAENDIWECLVFKNPFTFPMTTAPATIYTSGNFSGQSQLNWVNPGREATLKITKALSVKTEVAEVEDQSVPRTSVQMNNNQMTKITLSGTIKLTNYRDQPVEIRIRKQFFGQYLSGSDEPKVQVLPQSWYSANLLNQLEWTVTLKPDEEKTLNYQYSMLNY